MRDMILKNHELVNAGLILKTLHIPSGATDMHLSIAVVFRCCFAGASRPISISEPYLVSERQVKKTVALLDGLVLSTQKRKMKPASHVRSLGNREMSCSLLPLPSARKTFPCRCF